MASIFVKTADALYEVQEDERRFRRIGPPVRGAEYPDGRWQEFEVMSPVVKDQPLRFFWTRDLPGASPVRARVWSTTPVMGFLRPGGGGDG